MKVDIAMPLGYENEIIADLQTRRAEHHDLETRGRMHLVHALVPLANMFGYTNTLKSITFGRAAYKMVFAHYSPVPQDPDDGSFRPAVGMRA
jgi:elongation factor G